MIQTNSHIPVPRLQDLIETLIARHGVWRVLRAVIAGGLPRRTRRPVAEDLSDHLRRDVGLPPAQPPPRLRDIWL